MPQEIQIVPKWLHSHVDTVINDYTMFEDAAAVAVDTNSKFICVFRSPMGIDNTIVKKTDLKDFYATFGKSDYAKFGQPLMMPIAMLSTGSASCYCMRVMPEDAYAANCVLVMNYKFDVDSGKMLVKYTTSYIDKSVFGNDTSSYKTHKQFKKQLRVRAQTLLKTEPDSDGWCQIPLVTFRMAGRGAYGNKYRWRIARNMDYENDYGIKMFSFEALNTMSGLSKVATYVGCMATSDKYVGLTLINDILDARDTGDAVMDVQVFEDYYREVYDKYVEFVSTVDDTLTVPDFDCFDPFFGLTVGGADAQPCIEIVAETDGSDNISVDRPQGTQLAGGDDGLFSDTNDAQKIYEESTKAYVQAFNGDLDRKILSTRRVPADAILDANYPFEVKQALADLVNFRNDCLLYLDAGIDTTLGGIDNVISEYAMFNTRNISKEFQHYTVRDYGNNKKCEVTITFFYAQVLAKHYRKYGSHIPFVKAYAQLSGHVKDSLEPVIDDIDMEVKEKLYTNRINYFETIEENVYQRCSQNTAQMENSDLMEENNMNTLFLLKKRLERDCWNRLYDFTSAEDRARFSEVENAKFAPWQGSRLDTININFDVNEWEMERSIVHCYVAVQFRNLMKRCIIEIDVNKRNFLG